MKKFYLLFTFAVLFSTVNGFAESDRYRWGYWALERGSFDDAIHHFKLGADAGYRDCKGALANVYAAGLGTAKNPSKAFSYLKEADFAKDFFWIFFYTGMDLNEVFNKDIMKTFWSSGFSSIPKYQQYLSSGKHNCYSFGQSPNMAEATKRLKQLYQKGGNIDSWLDCSETISDGRQKLEEIFFNKFFSYAKKTNDTELIEILRGANRTAVEDYFNAIASKNDSINYAKTKKDIESLRTFKNNAKTAIWKEKAEKAIVELEREEKYQALVAGGKINNDELANFIKQYGTTYKEIDKYNNSAIKDLLINYFTAIDNNQNAAKQELRRVESYFSLSGQETEVVGILKEANEFRNSNNKYERQILSYGADGYASMKYNAFQLEKKMAEKYGITRNVVSREQIFASAQKLYDDAKSKNAVSLASNWTGETPMAEMNEAVEATNNESDKAEVMKYYNNIASVKIASMNQNMDKEELESIYTLKYMDNGLKSEAKRTVRKMYNKQNPAFRWGVEVDGGLTGAMKTLEYGGGAAVVLGRRSQMFNLYVGGQYAGCTGRLGGVSITEESNWGPISQPSHYINYSMVQIPVELRYNFARNTDACVYLGAGAVYNMGLKGKVCHYTGDSDVEQQAPVDLSDGLNSSNIAARISLGGTVMGFDMALYANYNLSSPYNTEATTDNFSVYEGYIHTQLKTKFTIGLRLGIYF